MADAEPLIRQAIGALETGESSDRTALPLAYTDLATVSVAKHQQGEAEQLLRRSLTLLETALGPTT